MEGITQAVHATADHLSLSDKYRNEQVDSSHGYLSGYTPNGKGISEQTNQLRELFPSIGFADEKLAEGALPENAEGWFAIPKWQSFAPSHGEAVELLLKKLRETHNGAFYNYRKGELGPDQLRQSAKTASVLQKLAEEQNGFDILVVAAQFGLCHRGRSVRRVREIYAPNEFGLGAFAIGIMLLTHPERLAHYDDLWIDCAGDELSPNADGDFSMSLNFAFDGGKLGFGTSRVSLASGSYGSVSGFIPQ